MKRHLPPAAALERNGLLYHMPTGFSDETKTAGLAAEAAALFKKD